MKALPDFSAYPSRRQPQARNHHRRNHPAEIIVASIVFGVFFPLLMLGMMLLGARIHEGAYPDGHGIMTFRRGALELLFAIWGSIEGAVGGFVASLFLVSALERKPLGRVLGRTLLIHLIPVSLLGFLIGFFSIGVIGFGFFALIGGSFAITCAWIARSIPNITRICHCAHCSYDMTGSLSGTCPECGTEFTARIVEPEPEKPKATST